MVIRMEKYILELKPLHYKCTLYPVLYLRRAGPARLTDASLMLRWGMLHSGYRESKYWWELVVMLRKYFIIGLVTFQNRDEFQLHVCALFVATATLAFVESVKSVPRLKHAYQHLHVLSSF
jgi:hypothetical protein